MKTTQVEAHMATSESWPTRQGDHRQQTLIIVVEIVSGKAMRTQRS